MADVFHPIDNAQDVEFDERIPMFDNEERLTDWGLQPYAPGADKFRRDRRFHNRYGVSVFIWGSSSDAVFQDRPVFQVSYGNRDGGGGNEMSLENNSFLESRTNFFRLQRHLFEDVGGDLEIYPTDLGFERDHFFALFFSKPAMGDRIDPLDFEIVFSLGYEKTDGSNGTVELRLDAASGTREDRRDLTPKVTPSFSGVAAPSSYGFLFPKAGVALLNPDALTKHLFSAATNPESPQFLSDLVPHTRFTREIFNDGRDFAVASSGSPIEYFVQEGQPDGIDGPFDDAPIDNAGRFLEALSSIRGHGFHRSFRKGIEITIPDTVWSSTNPTWTPGDPPRPTTVGLYDDEGGLVAVGKLTDGSQPPMEILPHHVYESIPVTLS